MNKYLKVMFGNKDVNFEYKLNEVNIANNWNPSAKSEKNFDRFNYTYADSIIRWLYRGTYIFYVKVPKSSLQ